MAGSGAGDMHHKMSKKVAQLTKVIYALHTRNDDCEFEKAHLVKHYEGEIEQILKNCTERLESYKKQNDELSGGKQVDQALKKLAARHDAEKKEMSSKFGEFKAQLSSEAEQGRKLAEGKLAETSRELEARKAGFEKHLVQFREATSKLEGCGQQAIDELKKKHGEEMEAHVVSQNSRYQEMLKQRLEAEDELEREHAAAMLLLEQEHTAREKSIKAQCQLDKAQAVEQVEAQMRAQQAAHVDKLKLVTEQLGLKQAELTEAEQALKKLSQQHTALQASHSALEAQLASLKSQLDASSQGAASEVQSLRAKITSLEADLSARAQKESTLRGDLSAAEADAKQHKQNGLKLQQEMDQLRQKLEALSSGSESALRNLEATVQTQRLEIDRNAGESAKLSQSLAKCKELLEAAEASAKKWNKEHDAVLNAKQQGEKQAAEALKQTKSEYEAKLKALQEQLVLQAKQSAQSADSAQAAMLSKMQLQHQNALDKLKAQIAALLAKAEADAKAAKEGCAKAVAEACKSEQAKSVAEMKAAAEGFNKQINDMMAKLKQSNAELEKQQEAGAALKKKLTDQEKQSTELSKELKAKEQQLSTALAKIKELEATLAKANAGSSDAAGAAKQWKDKAEALEKQVSALKAQLEAQSKQAQAELSAKVCGLNEHWSTRLAQEKQDATSKLSKQHQAAVLQMQKDAELAQAKLQQKHAAELAALKEHKQQAEAAKAKELAALKDKHAAELLAAQKALQDAKDQMAQGASQELKQALIQLEARLNTEHAAALSAQQATNVADLTKLRQEHSEAIKVLKQQGVETVQAAREQEVNKAKASLKSCEARLGAEHKKAMEALAEAELNKIGALERSKEQLEAKLKGCEHRIGELETSEGGLSVKLKAAEEQLQGEMQRNRQQQDRSSKEQQQQLAEMRAEHEGELEQMRSSFEQRTEQLEASHQESMDESEELLIKLQMRVSDLESKYNKRDSRPDDMERIRKLEEQVALGLEEVDRVEQEMKFFKLELVNREENFNKNFGSQPRVGVMDPGMQPKKSQSQSNMASKGRSDTKFPTLGPTSTSAPSGPSGTRPRLGRRGSAGPC